MKEIESTREMTRNDVAEYLREFAIQLDTSDEPVTSPTQGGDPNDGRVILMVGDTSSTINPPETVTFEVQVDTDSSIVGSEVEQEVEFDISWETEVATEDEEALEIK